MSALVRVTTPVKKQVAAATDSPGTWRHPRLDEITRRRDAANFSEKNVRRIAYNIVALLAMWSVQLLAKFKVDAQMFPKSFRLYLGWAWFLAQLLPFVQIGMACLPLIRPKDELSDIPLTATQRKLLGLDPTAIPPTPDAKFSTPPRYSRTPSMAGSVGSRASYGGSPLDGRGEGRGSPTSIPLSQSFGGSVSQFSPIGSPLLQSVNSMSYRRSSFGSPGSFGGSLNGSFGASFGASTSSNIFPDPTSPSPSGGKRTSIGLNNKWLYEKGRKSSGSAWVH
ncbi:nuclear pore complex component [Trichoderma cornu-damae]|uniref:Nuclear pore complex component n=1 Tax=Trichoderma cornu-damae TaxID=654480 RepID=A0A9P8QYR4_9HYPO|nr:nuclear pore complex component [Trichoderma cornu-damae]